MSANILIYYRPHSEGMVKVLFSQVSICPHLEGGTSIWLMGGGTPILPNGDTLSFLTEGEGYPILPDRGGQDWMGVPPPCWAWKQVHPRTIRRRSSRVSTCYTVGSMPLAFTQEDFLVVLCVCGAAFVIEVI